MKKFKSLLIVLLLIIVGFSSISFATMPDFENMEKVEENDEQIITMSDKTVEFNKEFYLILNLSNISFSKFKVEITNTSKLSMDEITSNVSDLSINSVVTSFVVDKTSINLEKLGIVYTSPKEECLINFEVKITSLDETVDDLKNEQVVIQTELKTLENNLDVLNSNLEILEESLKGFEEGTEEYNNLLSKIEIEKNNITETEKSIEDKNKENEVLNDKIENFKQEELLEKTEIEVVEKSQSNESENQKNPWDDKDNMLMMEEKNKEMTNSMKEMMTKMNNLETNLKDANNTISSLTKNVTYQGSQNNYLKSLSIDCVEFKNNFKKTTLDYFSTVTSDVSKVTVNAIPEDSTAIVTIYGNTDLKEGKNKILITVTADDDSIKTYRIYITK